MWIIIFFIVSVCVNCVVSQDVGDKCTNNDLELEGTCTLVINCEVAIQAIKRKKFNQYKRCGFSGLVEVVCCPQNNMRFGSHDRENTQRISEKECSKIIASSTPVLDLHILGGEEAAVGEFPHQVALGYSIGDDFDFKCGGSVLSPTYVLTAAHCVDTADRITPTIVRAGVIEIGGTQWNDSTDYRIADIKLHPNYVRKEKYHDLALLRLQRPLQFSYTLNAICLETSSEDPKISLTVTGWGQTSVQRVTNSRILLKTNVTAVPRDKCAESYTLWRKLPVGISQDQLCAGDPEGKRDTCQGDSGGPIVATSANGTNTLVGVTSFGRGCGSAIPGVYTRISSYLDWIERIVWPSQAS